MQKIHSSNEIYKEIKSEVFKKVKQAQLTPMVSGSINNWQVSCMKPLNELAECFGVVFPKEA
jgi:hypothetical protein